MKLKILPIVYVIIFAALMLVIGYATNTINFTFRNQGPIAGLIFISGISIVLIGGYQFRKTSTTVNPLNPEESSKLVTTGIYRFSRNPMYIGFFLFLVAWDVILGSIPSLIMLPVFVLLINEVQIKPEEAILKEKFGTEYEMYLKNVRRWI